MDWMKNAMSNPAFHMGLGLLGSGGNVQGALLGLNSYQQMQQAQLMNQYQQAQMAQMVAEQKERERQAKAEEELRMRQEEYLRNLPPEIAATYGAFPGIGREMIKGHLMPEQPDPYTLAPGAVRYGGDNKPIAFGLPQQPSTVVNTGNSMLPTPEQTLREDVLARAKDAREYNAGLVKAGSSAVPRIQSYDKMLKLLDNVETGTFEEAKLNLKKVANGLGIPVDIEKIADAEQLRVFLGDEIMSRVAETKGAVSEKEMDLFTQYSANYGNTTEGNRKIIKFKRAQAERDIKIQRMIREMQKKNKTSMEIRDAVENYIAGNDISNILTPSEGGVKFLGFE